MNWKKFLLIALAVGAFAFAAAPQAEARVSVGIGLGFPIGIGYNGYGNQGYGYGYGNQGCYPYSSYDYYGYRPRYYSRPVVYVGYHGRRVYRHRHHYRHWR